MSKENIRRFPSLKSNATGTVGERRESRENIKTSETSEQFKTASSQEIELAKKIQNKIRMRKRSSNPLSNTHALDATQDQALGFSNLPTVNPGDTDKDFIPDLVNEYFDEGINLTELIERAWDQDANLIEKTIHPAISRNILKELIMQDSNIIICQLGRGQRIEDVLAEKGERIIRS